MTEFTVVYRSAILALGCLGGLYLLQLIVADVVGIVRGHVPGTPVAGGHDDLLFRATRAHANTTESIGAVILISAFAMLRSADAAWVNGCLWLYVACRVVHTGAYYLDVRLLRSVAFAGGLIALVVLLVAAI